MTSVNTPKHFFPLPGFYGVMGMDPVAMVQDLEDEGAEREARAMHTKKYLVYLYNPIELPWPDRPWYGYYVYPIGRTLRVEDPSKAITSDMCIPIAPNTEHPTGRPPLVTEPPFPFSNCYHWADALTRVRIRAGQDFDESRAVHLPNIAQIQMQDIFEEDMDRAYDTLEQRQQANGHSTTSHMHPAFGSTSIPGSVPARIGGASARTADDRSLEDELDGQSCHASSSRSNAPRQSLSPSIDSLDAFAALDPFGFNMDDDILLAPLVDFCFDLTDHLLQEDIASPDEFWMEREQILSIMKAARERATRSLTAPIVSPIYQDDLAIFAAAKNVVQAAKELVPTDAVMHVAPPDADVSTAKSTQPKGQVHISSRRHIRRYAQHMAHVLHPRSAIRLLRGTVRQASRAIMTLPYIPYWP